jgi:predicted PurR-regulated permease PerM
MTEAARREFAQTRVHPGVDRAAGYAWRFLAIGLAAAAVLWLAGQLLVVVIPVGVGLLLARGLWPLARVLVRLGCPRPLAAATAVFGFVLATAAVVAGISWAVADEADELQPAISGGVDRVEDWLVDDSPFDVSRADADQWRSQIGEAFDEFLRSGDGSVMSGAVLVGEIAVGIVLALVVAFFLIKDGRRATARAIASAAPDRRAPIRRAIERGWDGLGGYLRGAALLGAVEAVITGVALAAVGGDIVVPVMVLTFIAAFVPIVGATAAGVVAVLVALVTAGGKEALIVGGVVLVVQQLDNDVLAPVIYGRALRLNPLLILLGIGAAGALFGLVGTLFAVPAMAVTLNAISGYRESHVA